MPPVLSWNACASSFLRRFHKAHRIPHRHGASPERGQSLLELALILPVLFVLLFAVINAAIILRSWQALQQAAFAGARAAALTHDSAYAGGVVQANLSSFGRSSDPGFPRVSISSTQPGTARNPHYPPPGPSGVYCHSVTVANMITEATPGLAADAQNYLTQYYSEHAGECGGNFDRDHMVTVSISYTAYVAGPYFPQWIIPLRVQATARIEDAP